MRNLHSKNRMVEVDSAVEVLRDLRGETFDSIYDLFFDEKRMIVAVVLHPLDLADEYRKPDSLTSIFLGNTLKSQKIKKLSAKLIEERRLAFKNKSLNEIFAMNEANVEINYENIASVTLKKGLLTASLKFEVQNRPKRKMSFTLKGNQIAEVERIMSKMLPGKFVIAS